MDRYNADYVPSRDERKRHDATKSASIAAWRYGKYPSSRRTSAMTIGSRDLMALPHAQPVGRAHAAKSLKEIVRKTVMRLDCETP